MKRSGDRVVLPELSDGYYWARSYGGRLLHIFERGGLTLCAPQQRPAGSRVTDKWEAFSGTFNERKKCVECVAAHAKASKGAK